MIAALYVETNGVYYNLPDVDPWDEQRDARLYAGPWPVVAHPPCNRWTRLAPLIEAATGHKLGDDGGTFAAALAAVRAFGGVLEHPEHSYAWAAHNLPEPIADGWLATFCGGWVAHVEQERYGHVARKPTWLYAVTPDPPPLRFGRRKPRPDDAGWYVNADRENERARGATKRLRGKRASATPPDFRDVLLDLARSARVGVSGQV